MKVCMISGIAKFSGGLEHVVDELSAFLTKRGVAVDIFGQSNQDFIEFEHNCRIIGCHPYSLFPHRIGLPIGKFEYNLKAWRKTRSFGPYDIIHGHGDNCFFSSLFRERERESVRTPFLMTFHGTMAKSLQRSVGLRYKLLCYPEKVAAARCDIAVACSKAVKNELIQYYGVPSKKITIIHNGINVEKFMPIDKKRARRKLLLPECNTYALWVGSNPYRKGLLMAVKAVEKSYCSKLLVVGMHGRNSEKTIFLGKLSEQDLITVYSAADVLIFPTIYEGFPMVPLEALACGLPVIVSEESNMSEIIKTDIHGFVVKDKTIAAYSEKIDYILNDATVLKDMSFKCRRLALDYCWQNQAEKYWLLYHKLLKNQ